MSVKHRGLQSVAYEYKYRSSVVSKKITSADGVLNLVVVLTNWATITSFNLSNTFTLVAFDKWIEKHHNEKPFVNYANDIVVHCKTKIQARYVLAIIRKRFVDYKFTLNLAKTRIILMRDITQENNAIQPAAALTL